ncbi:hypothetical protein [Plantactinospora sp. KBS50]|uniref:hypothetical protein n=1 Tax=Plantactinospora sp. KBS50 TaxID=2024580 RepID=UPI000BAB2150|nr:hypothetical protein [Plantactinospora sp. KBS50]ASW55444.1 hypothetical protein CIK06_16605 [Plantactinospora sp. KBS50]
MSEDRLIEVADVERGEEGAGQESGERFGMLELMSRVPFGARVAVLAGVVATSAGAAELISVINGGSTTCCPPSAM